MIKLENTMVVGWEPAIRGMRNPMNSWDKSDTMYNSCETVFEIGPNDLMLMKKLCKGGPDDRKFLRMIVVYVDITAPLYWWKEAETYKVGTVANSCSTMHKIHDKEFTIDDFSHEHLIDDTFFGYIMPNFLLSDGIIKALNECRSLYLETKDKRYWWQMIQLLPSSYNQRRTMMLNYEVLRNIYQARKNHKLDEWHDFCRWIESLPYSYELIFGDNPAMEWKMKNCCIGSEEATIDVEITPDDIFNGADDDYVLSLCKGALSLRSENAR